MTDQLKGKEILRIIQAIANEKRLAEEIIFVAVEKALADVAEKSVGEEALMRVSIDRDSGERQHYRQWLVVESSDEAEFPGHVLELEAAKAIDEGAEIGAHVEQAIELEHGRISAHLAGQIMSRIVREAERAQLAQRFQEKVGTMVNAQVKQVTRNAIILDLPEQIEATIPRSQLLPREIYRVGDQVCGYLYAVDPEVRGPMIFVSRIAPEFITTLFHNEVPEVQEGSVDIRAVARDPGVRAKVAVKTNDSRIDAVGACVGIRGSRVQAVSGELKGERIDVIEWSDDVTQLLIHAFAPVTISAIEIDEASGSMDVGVEEDQLSKAIGRNGQNVRLIGDLVGWHLNVMSIEQMQNKGDGANTLAVTRFMEALDVEEDLATILVREGFSHIEEIAYIDLESLAGIEEFDEGIAEALQERARAALLTQAMNATVEPEESLLQLPSMARDLAYRLAEHQVASAEALAELSIDELVDMVSIDEKLASKVIMEARKPWFDAEE